MKLAFISVIVVTIWSCSELEDQTTSTLTKDSSDSTAGSYLVGITMEKRDATSTKDVELIVYRKNGYPTCVGVSGFGSKQYVPLKKSGSGEWKAGTSTVGEYDRYGNTSSGDLDVTLHWTTRRGDMDMDDISRLEYFSAESNSDVYEYQHDADEKLGITIGELSATEPNNDFKNDCSS